MRVLTCGRLGTVLLSLGAIAAAAVSIPASASALTQTSPVVGHVYVNDNTTGTNTAIPEYTWMSSIRRRLPTAILNAGM